MPRRKKTDDTPTPRTFSRKDMSMKAWKQRVKDAEELHDEWEREFRCRELHSKYVGTHQWLEEEDPDGDKYFVNLFFSGIENRKPALVFNVPRFEVKPRPTRTDDQFSPSEYRSRLFQDSINTVASDRRVKMLFASLLSLQDSFFRFGCVEVGIEGDVVDNPRVGRPMMRDDMDALRDREGNQIIEGERLVASELPFVKRVPAQTVLISTSNENDTDRNDWVGYWSYVRKEDIWANPLYKKRARRRVKSGDKSVEEHTDITMTDQRHDSHMYVKLYRIWDLRAKEKRVFAEDSDDFLLVKKFRTLPLRFYRPHHILDSWYPVPPTYNWLPQQREVNEVRETGRTHRRRFLRKYTVIDGKIDPDQLDLLESGEDGTYARVPDHEVIKPLPDADLGRTFHLNIPQTMEDFMLVSGVTGERQGVQEAETATQANIIDTNARVRDLYAKQDVGRWIADIAYALLLVIAEHGSLPFWVNLNIDKTSVGGPQEATEIAQAWQLMQKSNFDVDEILNYEMDLDVETLSPSQDARMRQEWMNVIGLMSDPMVSLLMLASDTVLRKTLKLHGVTKEREISEIKAAVGKVQTYLIQREVLAAQGILTPPPLDVSTSGKPTPSGVPAGGPQGAQPGPGATPQLPTAQNTDTQLAGQVPPGGIPGGG